jgi:hypothetical protein
MSKIKSSTGDFEIEAVGSGNEIKMLSDTSHGDNVKAKFGASDDLEIYHDGSNSYINDTSGTGNLYIASNQLIINNSSNNENMARFAEDGAVTLYNNGSPTLATTSTGIDVTGTVTTDGVVSSGNVLAGRTTASGLDVDGHVLFEGGASYQSTTDNSIQFINRNGTGDGALTSYYKNGQAVGSIGASNTDLYLGSTDHGVKFHDTSNAIMPWVPSSNSADSSGTLDLGTSLYKFKDLYLSGGVYLGGTGAANKLDDYETGTFSLDPSVSGLKGTTTDPTYTLSRDANQYIKIGDYVTLYIDTFINGLSNEGAGNLYLVPPFTAASVGAGGEYYGSVAYSVGFDVEPYGYYLDNGTGRIYLLERNGAALSTSALSSSTRFRFSVTYRAA